MLQRRYRASNQSNPLAEQDVHEDNLKSDVTHDSDYSDAESHVSTDGTFMETDSQSDMLIDEVAIKSNNSRHKDNKIDQHNELSSSTQPNTNYPSVSRICPTLLPFPHKTHHALQITR